MSVSWSILRWRRYHPSRRAYTVRIRSKSFSFPQLFRKSYGSIFEKIKWDPVRCLLQRVARRSTAATFGETWRGFAKKRVFEYFWFWALFRFVHMYIENVRRFWITLPPRFENNSAQAVFFYFFAESHKRYTTNFFTKVPIICWQTSEINVQSNRNITSCYIILKNKTSWKRKLEKVN